MDGMTDSTLYSRNLVICRLRRRLQIFEGPRGPRGGGWRINCGCVNLVEKLAHLVGIRTFVVEEFDEFGGRKESWLKFFGRQIK